MFSSLAICTIFMYKAVNIQMHCSLLFPSSITDSSFGLQRKSQFSGGISKSPERWNLVHLAN
ncbi:hypothetical protein CW304_10560 [Bacillus sp. UFRGS-B20]|nr:hypothetical protein CW304_10560 [Bacillus sp. UFRGS-B20]